MMPPGLHCASESALRSYRPRQIVGRERERRYRSIIYICMNTHAWETQISIHKYILYIYIEREGSSTILGMSADMSIAQNRSSEWRYKSVWPGPIKNGIRWRAPKRPRISTSCRHRSRVYGGKAWIGLWIECWARLQVGALQIEPQPCIYIYIYVCMHTCKYYMYTHIHISRWDALRTSSPFKHGFHRHTPQPARRKVQLGPISVNLPECANINMHIYLEMHSC